VLLPALVCLAEPPKDVGLVERTERTLVQLTVRITPRTAEYRSRAAHLTKGDLTVLLDDKEIPAEQFELDGFCPEPDGEEPSLADRRSKHVLFFVDALGLEGQDNTIAMLRTMIPRMAADGYEMKLLPGPNPSWTRDVGRLLEDAGAAVDPWSRPPSAGPSPEEELRALLEANEVDRAIELAREMERAAQLSFEGPPLQLARAISEMGSLPMPKAMIYFAELGGSFREMIVDTAIRSGVAVYAVKADGLGPYVPDLKTAVDPSAIITTSLSALSEHTGGRFSLGHYRPSAAEKVLKRVESDLSCVYVVSLDAARLDRDRMLRPKIKLNSSLRSQLVAETIPDLTIPSEKRRQELSVSIALRSADWPGVQPAHVSLVPFAFDASKATALLQFSLGADVDAPSVATAWDLGLNYFGASRVSGHGGMRVTSTSSKIVFEKKVRLPVGPYSIIGVAQEVGNAGLARGTAAGVLSRPKKSEVGFLHPLDLMQSEPGTYVSENGTARKAGWSALRYGMAASDRPIALVTSVCRGANVHGPLTVDKTLLLPHEELHAPRTIWHEQGSPCLVIRDDVLKDGELPWSHAPYETTLVVTVSDPSGRTVAKSSKAFWVIGPGR
jgi:hypothetical protein